LPLPPDFHRALARDLEYSRVNFGTIAMPGRPRTFVAGRRKALGTSSAKGAEHCRASDKASVCELTSYEGPPRRPPGHILAMAPSRASRPLLVVAVAARPSPENVPNGGGHVAIGFVERLLQSIIPAIGKFAQFANGASSDFSHTESFREFRSLGI